MSKDSSRLEQPSAKGPTKPDIPSLMAEIRARVKADVEKHRDGRAAFKPYAADAEAGSAYKAGHLLHAEELRYLNANYAFAPRLNLDAVSSHRRGLLAKLLVKAKRKVLQVVWDFLLRDYFTAEREFQANLVRLLNDISKYVDARDASNFWELIRKIDYDVTKVGERVERVNDEQMASLRSSEKRIFDEFNSSLRDLSQRLGKLQAEGMQYGARLGSLDRVTQGLEGIIAGLSPPRERGAAAPEGACSKKLSRSIPDYSYLLLENRYRGSEEDIARRLEIYPAIFSAAPAAVLEIGPGRGELLDLMAKAGIKAYGVDSNAAMVESAKKKGLNVLHEDARFHLRNLAACSLGGVVAVQVAEHLHHEELRELLALCAQKIVKGGRVVLETINPVSMTALCSNYWRDPTHVWPLHPDTLSFMMTLAGLKVIEIQRLSPVPKEAQLREIPVQEYMTPRWRETVELINYNISQLNDLLYGYQDYCIVAEA